MPRFDSEKFGDDRSYVFYRKSHQKLPPGNSRALRAFWKHSEAFQWAMINLDDFTIASNLQR